MEWAGASLTDETHATHPPDFRDKRIHHAFRAQP
jgi:hypothetical protein